MCAIGQLVCEGGQVVRGLSSGARKWLGGVAQIFSVPVVEGLVAVPYNSYDDRDGEDHS